MHRAMGFATLALVTLAPLLIVVAAADPWCGAASPPGSPTAWAVRPVRPRAHRHHQPPRKVIGTTSAFGGVSCSPCSACPSAAAVQNAYERIWGLASGPWHRVWRQATWLVVLMAYLYQEAATKSALHGTVRIVLSMVSGVLFFWWGAALPARRPGALALAAARRGGHGPGPGRPARLLLPRLHPAHRRQRPELRRRRHRPRRRVLAPSASGTSSTAAPCSGRWFTEHHWMPSHHHEEPAGTDGDGLS